ncbi:MAG: hypothetical protein ACI94Y_001393 [Maribacter sp.]|jgi:hypothetical protein
MNTPDSIISDNRYNFGRYTAPFKNVNLLDAPKSAPLNFMNFFFLREWQAFQIFTEGYFGMMAIYNTKKVSLVQFILYDIENNKKIRFEKKVLPWQLEIPSGLFKTQASYTSNNCKMMVKHDIENHRMTIDVDIKKSKKNPRIKATLNAIHNVQKNTPIVVCMPFNEDKGMYSHKCLMPLEGSIILDDKEIILNQNNSNLILDDHKGYYPYVTKYDWVTAAGFTKDGKRIGFNFTDNQIQNKEKYNENGIWLDGEMTYLPPITVERPQGYKNDWIIKDKEGKVNITFTPVVHHAVRLNLLILKSDYQGPYGYFNGFVKTDKQDEILIDNLFGMGEDFYLRT